MLLKDTSSPTYVEPELALWAQLAFSFDMENEPHRAITDNQRVHGSRRSRSNSQSLAGRSTVIIQDERDAELLEQFAAATEIPLHEIAQPHSFGSLISPAGHPQSRFTDGPFSHGHSFGQTSLPPSPSMDFHWNQFPSPQSNQDPYRTAQRAFPHLDMLTFPESYMSSQSAPGMTGPPPSVASMSRSSRHTSVSNIPATSSSAGLGGSLDPESTEAEHGAIAEEKRRRNTAASARFRIKKKQRTTNLERSVSDLSGRAEDLEREAADLRRENGWLKEIVMLKGSRLAAVNLASHLIQNSVEGGTEELQDNLPENSASDSDGPSISERKKNRSGKSKKKDHSGKKKE
ncbi:hypothetical protein BDZ94DRAFT_1301288 [Collybia nuda]|uniref:BZIP domain-containing protein n=1 Tax=Collybia nuda TaxID=64659 RepID=A0A9P5XX66_9AGAR|nr:hypothetical protein BDZ94DRAFT_1301288 [Collybia nuda]